MLLLFIFNQSWITRYFPEVNIRPRTSLCARAFFLSKDTLFQIIVNKSLTLSSVGIISQGC